MASRTNEAAGHCKRRMTKDGEFSVMQNQSKAILTAKEITQDIIHSLKQPNDPSKSQFNRYWHPVGILIVSVFSVIDLVFMIVSPLLSLIVFICFMFLFVLPVGWAFLKIQDLRLRHKVKSICMDDYEITTLAISGATEESYLQRIPFVSKKKCNRINNYTLWFENRESWRIPKEIYTWNPERATSDFALYQNTHCGDVFWVITYKATGKIAMAYHTDFFEYKRNNA